MRIGGGGAYQPQFSHHMYLPVDRDAPADAPAAATVLVNAGRPEPPPPPAPEPPSSASPAAGAGCRLRPWTRSDAPRTAWQPPRAARQTKNRSR